MNRHREHRWAPGLREILARAIHEEYVRRSRLKGTAPTNGTMVSWEDLPEALKESNRAQADHIPTKLAMIGFAVSVATDDDAADEILVEELESMARLEHERWVDERRANGWTLGAKDTARQQTPYLIPYDELPEEIKEYDRDVVRALPLVLARAGMSMRRLKRTQ